MTESGDGEAQGVAVTGADDGYSRVLAQVDAHVSADAMAVGAAVYAEVGLADRLRGSIGMVVGIRTRTGDEAIAGTVVEVAADGAVVIEELRSAVAWIVMPTGLESIAGLAPGHRRAGDRVAQHRSSGALLRPAVGSAVAVAVGARRISGTLERVGADHLQVATSGGQQVVPFGAISWVKAARPAVMDPIG